MKIIQDQTRTTKDTQPAQPQPEEILELTVAQMSQVGGARINLHRYP